MLLCPSRDQGAKRSGVATAGSEVSFIELIGGARTQTPCRFQDFSIPQRMVPFRKRRLAAQLISRPDKRRDPQWLRSWRFRIVFDGAEL